MKKILLCTLSLILCFTIFPLQANETRSLMIVAHPDDETIWGGDHLLHGNYTVLCITNGNNKKRKKEFMQAMKKTHSQGIILNYPDKTNGQRDNWNSCKKAIQKDIQKEIDSNNWDMIVTHNPNGEYGHIHHKMVSKFVTKIVKKEKKTKKLVYFGQYTARKNKINLKNEKRISKQDYKEKIKVIQVYASQDKVMDHLHHMLPYENWIAYNNWGTIK